VLTIRDDTMRRASEDAMAQALRIKDVMLQEVNHRVTNNLQLVTSLLALQANRTSSPQVAASLNEARARLGVVAGMHQRLYTSAQYEKVNLSNYLRELATDTIGALNSDGRIELHFSADRTLFVTLENAVPIALIVNELLTNAMKYAFQKSAHGSVSISLSHQGSDVCIAVSDDGSGLPDDFDAATSTGLGMLIVTALVTQLKGALSTIDSDQGAGFMISIPSDILEGTSAPGD
jgi:two-component sensor histidine kinase